MTWMPSQSGRAIDLVEPSADQVDFRGMAHALANTNRYNGHGEQQVSVALHLLIGLDFCPDALKPWWLLHDGHEERLGDIATPTKDALVAIAREKFGDEAAEWFAGTIREFKRRHDRIIHAAAGLPMPSEAQREQIAVIDLRCLATEHRDFHRPSTRRWAHEDMNIMPARTIRRWLPPDKAAEQLLRRFELHLPALRALAA